MGEFVFTIAKGAIAEKARAGGSLGVMLLKRAEPDTVLQGYRSVAEMLASGNDEADFTGYQRKTGLSGSVRVDDPDSHIDVAVPSVRFERPAGGDVDNDLVKLVVFHEEGDSDSARVPLTAHDLRAKTDGNPFTVEFATDGFFRAV